MVGSVAAGSDIFKAMTALPQLDAAWERVRANGGCAGGDGMTVPRFQARAGAALNALMLALRAGDYQPGPMRVVRIPKPSGETRPLTIPSVIDRIAQTAAAQALTPILEPEFSDASFAYRPGRSVDKAVQAVSRWRAEGYSHVVEADIVRCFERIPVDRVIERLDAILGRRRGAARMLDLAALWGEQASTALGTPGIGLAQGSPLSPLLANLHLDNLDNALERSGVRLVRFADDFIILCKDAALAHDMLDETATILAAEGLELRRDKTRVVDFDRGFRFLGHLFVRSMVMKQVADPDEDAVGWMRDIASQDAETADAAEAAEARAAEERTRGFDRGQRVLHLLGAGRRLGLRNMSFAVTEAEKAGGGELIAVHSDRVDRIEIGPDADIDADAIRLALAAGVSLAFISGGGETEGWLTTPDYDRASLHLSQAQIALNPVFATALARRIVEARVRNQRAQLRLLNRTAADADVAAAAAGLGPVLSKLKRARDVAAIRGHEGRAAAIYWPALAMLAGEAQNFTRSRPARTPLNATVNYMTAILTRDVRAAIVRRGLHPGFGVLHTARDGGEACVWDLMEAFRAPLTEGIAVALFNQGRIKADMFSRAGTGIRIGNPARGAIIRGYEAAASRMTKSKATGKRRSWRGLIDDAAASYAVHCQTEGAQPFQTHLVDY